jgi:hypothetical protein
LVAEEKYLGVLASHLLLQDFICLSAAIMLSYSGYE